jgi:hypothetical protein
MHNFAPRIGLAWDFVGEGSGPFVSNSYVNGATI